MAPSRDSDTVEWFTAVQRGILPIAGFHLPKNAQKIVRQRNYAIRFNTHFRSVVSQCARRPSTWINPLIEESYVRLHRLGYAHSVEIWQHGTLVGGLYGVALQSAFFGESMFKTHPEMDKAALWACRNRLLKRGFQLWDAQFHTPHLARFGGQEIPKADYDILLERALLHQAHFD